MGNCFSSGFTLYHKNDPIFAYTGDSAFDEELYRTVFQAPIILLDGRLAATASTEHATVSHTSQSVKGKMLLVNSTLRIKLTPAQPKPVFFTMEMP